MRFLIIDSYYPDFLESVYAKHSDLENSSYREQLDFLLSTAFGTSDFYSSNLKKLGHEAVDIISNYRPLQLRWVREYGRESSVYKWHLAKGELILPRPFRRVVQSWAEEILFQQIKKYKPDVLYVQCVTSLSADFLKKIKPYSCLIVGQIAAAYPVEYNFCGYDLILSSLPHYVNHFRSQGIKSEYFRIGFEASILSRLKTLPQQNEIVHVGGYGPIHQDRNMLLEYLIKDGLPVKCWGYGVDNLSLNSPIRSVYQGSAWGLDMYNVRHNSKIVVSKHINSVADKCANIMTLYEATGLGSLLVIDKRSDLSDIFKVGEEVVAYSSPQECAEIMRYYLSHEEKRASIAAAGQRRTLSEHTYYKRMQELCEILEKYL